MWLARPAAKVLWAKHQKKRHKKKKNSKLGVPTKQTKGSRDRWWSGKEQKPREKRWWSEPGSKISPEEKALEMRELEEEKWRLRKQDAEFAKEKERFEKKAYVAKHDQKEAAKILREEHRDVKRDQSDVRKAELDLKRRESELNKKYAAFREKMEDEKASIREEKRSLQLARERLREYSERVRETIDRAVDYVGEYHEQDEQLPTKQLWIRRILFMFTGFPIVGLYSESG